MDDISMIRIERSPGDGYIVWYRVGDHGWSSTMLRGDNLCDDDWSSVGFVPAVVYTINPALLGRE